MARSPVWENNEKEKEWESERTDYMHQEWQTREDANNREDREGTEGTAHTSQLGQVTLKLNVQTMSHNTPAGSSNVSGQVSLVIF